MIKKYLNFLKKNTEMFFDRKKNIEHQNSAEEYQEIHYLNDTDINSIAKNEKENKKLKMWVDLLKKQAININSTKYYKKKKIRCSFLNIGFSDYDFMYNVNICKIANIKKTKFWK